MILTMTQMFDVHGGRYSILAHAAWQCWVMEREWKFTRRNVSCVPRDEYLLEPHSTEKYPRTWALLGSGVSHSEIEGVPRYACVLHKAIFPSDLEGCLTLAKSISCYGAAHGPREAMDEFRELVSKATGPVKILMQ